MACPEILQHWFQMEADFPKEDDREVPSSGVQGELPGKAQSRAGACAPSLSIAWQPAHGHDLSMG